MTGRLIAITTVLCIASACGGASAAAFTADPRSYLLTLDELQTPGLSMTAPPALTGATSASVTFDRTADLATANGPVEVIDTVVRFASTSSAQGAYQHDIAARDGQSGESALSTGGLGDESHADSLVRTTAQGLQAVQITLEWRVANVTVVLEVRGRYGGTRLDDALMLAHRQTARSLSS